LRPANSSLLRTSLVLLLLAACPASGERGSSVLTEAEAVLARDPARALELALAVLGAEPELSQAHAVLGRAAAQSGQPALAVEHLGRALALGGETLQLRLYLASALWETGRYDDAEASFHRACELAGTGPRGQLAWHQLGRLLLWLARAPQAVAALERAVSLGSEAPDAALDFARALDLAGDPRALAAFTRAVALAPESPRARWGLAHALRAAGRREEAAAELEIFRELYQREQESVRSGGLVRASLDFAWSLLRDGDAEAAAAAFARLGEVAEAVEGRARAASARGRHREAVALLEAAVRRFPDREDLLQFLARERLAALAEAEP
jgi:tetratricopeptide (TPR) repeat protein